MRDADALDHRRVAEDGRRSGEVVEEPNSGTEQATADGHGRARPCDPGFMDAAHQVIQAAEARAVALADGDAERLKSLLHEDFRWTTHVGETFSRDE